MRFLLSHTLSRGLLPLALQHLRNQFSKLPLFLKKLRPSRCVSSNRLPLILKSN